eukprot:XP_024459504.1 uncharacterized protein LOC112327975 [Populus trichocarpa]
MEADFNPYSAKQREHEERMIRHLEDECKGDDDDNDDDDAEADGKKLMLSPEVANKRKSKITGAVKQSSANGITVMGPGYKGPNFHALRGYYLAKAVDEVKIFVESYQETWKKTVDALEASKTAVLLHKLFREVVLFVGPENIMHMVTDNASNYVAACKLLMEEFPSIFWSPCAAHCITLILQDIDKLQLVCSVVNHASSIIKEWVSSAYAKDSKGKRFVDSVLNSTFWEECASIVRLTEPLVRVLRIVDSDDRPAMGYLYEAIHSAKEEMLRRFQKKRTKYDVNLMDRYINTISGLLDDVEKYANGNAILLSKLTSEMKLFRNAEHDFGRVSAKNDRTLLPPNEWWVMYGTCAPNLQKLAIRVLSQTCSSSGCERN